MHEQGLVKTVLSRLSEVARSQGAGRLLAADLQVAPAGHVEPARLAEQLRLAAVGTAAEGADFRVTFGASSLEEHCVLIGSVRLAGAGARRLRLRLFGAVQGAGLRPFLFRLAKDSGLRGWVENGPAGVVLEAEGDEEVLRALPGRILRDKPEPVLIAGIEETWLEPTGSPAFEIRRSGAQGAKSAWLLPDLAACDACIEETRSPQERRFGYPFTNCTRCGPRFTIVTAIPYDRAHTTMDRFTMCPRCAAEYADPADRRFHAQPICCPDCGPRLWLEEGGVERAAGQGALARAAALIEEGAIVAVKGVGGFHLFCDAGSSSSVRLLRLRKGREEKPLAVMFPTLAAVRAACEVSQPEEDWLRSAAAPIVLLKKRQGSEGLGRLAPEAAPRNGSLGALLPYSPLHHMLLDRLRRPLVATSGNLSEEPIVTSNEEARARLSSLADALLLHDRPIARSADDSVVRLCRGRQALLRRSRGFAPLPIETSRPLRRVLAVGAQLKSTVSIAWQTRIVTSQHLGDLGTAASWRALQRAAADLRALYDFEPELVACDLHPDYASTRFAESLGLPLVRVQHHHAHVAACMAEQAVEPPVLGVAWDGLGLGSDGALWGGEFLRVDEKGAERLGHLRAFPLPGGAQAVREPRRAAWGMLSEAGLDTAGLAWRRGLSKEFSPMTTSAGRLFDSAASLLGLVQVNAFEGQAAMALEQAAARDAGAGFYPFPLRAGPAGAVADWAPLLEGLLRDRDQGAPAGLIAAKFHSSLARLILHAARAFGLPRVVLCGGVFQNSVLVEETVGLLEADGFRAFTPQRLPANDSAISAGQAFVAGLGWL